MPRRDHWTDEQRHAERIQNRERMARMLADPDYRNAANARRLRRDRERKATDPDLCQRLSENRKRYFLKRKGDPAFWAKRSEYLRRWRTERRIDEEFEDFMTRIEEAVHAEPV